MHADIALRHVAIDAPWQNGMDLWHSRSSSHQAEMLTNSSWSHRRATFSSRDIHATSSLILLHPSKQHSSVLGTHPSSFLPLHLFFKQKIQSTVASNHHSARPFIHPQHHPTFLNCHFPKSSVLSTAARRRRRKKKEEEKK